MPLIRLTARKNRLFRAVALTGAALLAACGGKEGRYVSGSPDTTRAPAVLTAGPATAIALEPVWVRVGDSQGAEDCECGTASVETAEFSPDGKYIISGSKKGWEVILWEAATGNKVWEKKLDEETESVAFSRDGRYVAVGGEDKTVRILDARDGREVKRLQLTGSVDGMRFSHRGDLLVGGDENGLIHAWRTTDWQEVRTAQQGPDGGADDGAKGQHADVNSVDFTADDRYVSTAGRNSVVRIWRVTDLSPVRTLTGHTGSVKSARISPDGKLVASASADPDTLKGDNSVRVWDFATGRPLAHFKHPKGMEAVEFSPDGKYLLAGGRQGGGYEVKTATNGFLYVYRIPADPQKEAITLVAQKPVFRSEYLHFSPDGKGLVSAHEDGTVRLWRVQQATE